MFTWAGATGRPARGGGITCSPSSRWMAWTARKWRRWACICL